MLVLCENCIAVAAVSFSFYCQSCISAISGALGSVLDKDFGNYSQQQGFGPEELQPELPLEGRHS